MKLSTQDTANLSTILATCSLGGIESIIIEDGLVRGVNEARTFVIISDHNVPKLPLKMGLSRLGSLKQRLDLFAGNASAVIEAKESDRGEMSSLEISAGRNKVQFRCTSTALIKAPKSVNDSEVFRIFFDGADEQKLLLNAIRVMGGSTIQLIIKKDRTVELKISDATNDVFHTVLSTPAELLDGDQDSVVHYYHADIFHAVMKSSSDNAATGFVVGNAGTIKTQVNGHTVVVMPKINEDSEED